MNLNNIWPEWKIEKELGRGAYGVVYSAVRNDYNMETHAAIKVISIPSNTAEVDTLRSEGLDLSETKTYLSELVNDFVREICLMESIRGLQNIVSVEDYKVVEKTDTVGWDIFIRMELLTPLNTYICDKKLTEEEVVKLGYDICTALEACAKRNIIHRDIKPENIFINDFGDYKLGDFGVARTLENLTDGLSQKGTYNYMAPEVTKSNEYDASADIYSLGIMLYRLLNNNRFPFVDTVKQLLSPSDRRIALERRLRGDALPAPVCASPEMSEVILTACAYDPEKRFKSAADMKNALCAVKDGTYKIAGSEPEKHKKRILIPTLLIILLASLIFGVVWISRNLVGGSSTHDSASTSESVEPNSRINKISTAPPETQAPETNASETEEETNTDDTASGNIDPDSLVNEFVMCGTTDSDDYYFGRNYYGELVYSTINTVFNDAEASSNVESVNTSWKGKIFRRGKLTWSNQKKGETWYERQSVPSKNRSNVLIRLPDNSELEGEQWIEISMGDIKVKFNFTLTYLGDYSVGIGWSMSDITYQVTDITQQDTALS